MFRTLREFVPTLALSTALVAVGCGDAKGPKKFIVSGTVTMKDGRPAPAGEIMFEPDADAGNKGAGSFTQIRNGSYSLPREQGIAGGKYVVFITPFDGKANVENAMGMPLVRAPHMEKLDLPAEDSVKDFQLAK